MCTLDGDDGLLTPWQRLQLRWFWLGGRYVDSRHPHSRDARKEDPSDGGSGLVQVAGDARRDL